MRPVFLLLMGFCLLLIAWRFARSGGPVWPARTMILGAVFLCFGYSLLLPLYSARVLIPIERIPFHPDRNPTWVTGWALAKMTALNGGWLLFGLGLALRARVFEPLPATRRPAA